MKTVIRVLTDVPNIAFHFLAKSLSRVTQLLLILTLPVLLIACSGASDGSGNSGNSPDADLSVDAGEDLIINEKGLVNIEGKVSGKNAPISQVQWQQISGPSVTLFTEVNSTRVSFVTPKVKTSRNITLRLSANTGGEFQVFDDIVITIPPELQPPPGSNNPPVIDGIPTAIAKPGTTVTLTASATDLETPGGNLQYEWFQITGVVLNDLQGINTDTITFTAPDTPTRLWFVVRVFDGNGASDMAGVLVEVVNNIPPVASAGGDINVTSGQEVIITGSGSDSDGTITGYLWTQLAGPPLVLTNAGTDTVSFTAPDVTSSTIILLTLMVIDNSGATDIDDIAIIVSPVLGNIPPTANAGPDLIANPGDTVIINGSGEDADGAIALYQWVVLQGPAGITLNGADTGVVSFVMPQDMQGEPGVVLELTVTDNEGATGTDQVIVTANLQPVANAGPDQSVLSGDTVNLSGSGSDDDGSIVSYLWSQVSGAAVTIADPNSANTSFVAPDVAGTITLRLKVTDNDGGEGTDDIVITVDGANIPPTADAGPDLEVSVGDNVSITGLGSDPDPNDTVSFQWTQVAGPAVTLSGADTDTISFTAPDVAATTVITLRLTVTDNNGASASDEVNITVTSTVANSPPTADAGVDQTVLVGDLVTLSGTGIDDDGTIASYQWQQLNGPAVDLVDANLPVATFIAPDVTEVSVIEMQLTVTDDLGATGNDQVLITVNPSNLPPIANAGDPQTVLPQDTVTLSGSGTDSDGTIASFSWTQLSGPSVTLSGANTATAAFTAPDVTNVTVLTFRLTVTDDKGATGTDDVAITVNGSGNIFPVANAGPDLTVNSGDPVSITGTGTDDDGTILAVFWTQLSGPQVTLSGSGTDTITFTAPVVGTQAEIELQFSVIDNNGGLGTDNVIVTVNPTTENQPPIASAGPDLAVNTGDTVTITGTGEDSDGTIDSFSWAQINGVSVTLVDAATNTVAFVAPLVAVSSKVTLELTVTDNLGATATDQVVITINPIVVNVPPVANAGSDVVVVMGETVSITGSGTDIDGAVVGYNWTQVSGPSVVLQGAITPTVSFTAPEVTQDTDIVLELRVTDTLGASATDQVTVTVTLPANLPPTANAGPDVTATAGDTVSITGTGEDPDGTIASFLWAQVNGPAVTLTGADTATVEFTAPDVTTAAQITLELTVTDDGGKSATDQVVITVDPPVVNSPPVASAGPDIATISGMTVSITGSGEDIDGTIAAFQWTQVNGPAVTLTGADTATVEFTAPDVANLTDMTLELTVTDDAGDTGTDQVIISVNPLAANAIPIADAGEDMSVSPFDNVALNGNGSDLDGTIASYQWTQTGGPAVTLTNAATQNATFQAPVIDTATELSFELMVTDDGGATDTDTMLVTVFPFTTLSGTISMAPGTMVDSDINDTSASAIFNANDTMADAQTIVNPVTLGGHVNLAGQGNNGRTFSSGDVDDYFAISMSGGQDITLYIGNVAGGANDLDLYLLDQAGQLVDASLGVGTATESLTVPSSGSYFINVRAADGASNYVLSVGVGTLNNLSNGWRISDDFQSGDLIVRFNDEVNKTSAGSTLSSRATTLALQGKGGAPGRDMLFGIGQGTQKAAAMNRLGVASLKAASVSVPGKLQDKLDTLLAAKALARRSDVRSVGLNYRYYPTAVPNDTNYSLQWHFPSINLPQAWDVTTGSADVIVAVIDTGVLLNHPDLQGQLVPGYDFVADDGNSGDGEPGIDANPDDPGDGGGVNPSSFHGTHVAGTIAAATNNGTGVAGIAWGAKVMPCRAVGINGGLRYDIEQCIRYVAGLSNDSNTTPAQPADIINLSLGGPTFTTTPPEAYTLARQAGVIIIGAAGNNATNELFAPAAYDGVVSVSATSINRQLASYSNFGATIDVAAPGGDAGDLNGDGFFDGILSTSGDDSTGDLVFAFRFSAGTSMAAPHMAGVVALMKSVHPELTPDQLDTMLANGDLTDDIGTPGRDNNFGHGIINAQKAVVAANEAGGGTNQPPPVPAVLQITPDSLNFGTNVTNVQINITNGGGGTLTVNGISNDSGGWLSVTPATTDADGLGSYDVNVTRTGLVDGTYSATITVNSSAGTQTVAVIMQVSGVFVVDNAGVQYVEIYDAVSSELFDRIIVVATDGVYNYEFTGVPLGTWHIRSGSDLDFDFVNCELGEACGAYPLLDDTVSQDIVVDGSTQLIEGLDFVTGFNVNLPVP